MKYFGWQQPISTAPLGCAQIGIGLRRAVRLLLHDQSAQFLQGERALKHAEARHGCEKHSPDFQPGRSGMQRGEGARLGVEDVLLEEGVSGLSIG